MTRGAQGKTSLNAGLSEMNQGVKERDVALVPGTHLRLPPCITLLVSKYAVNAGFCGTL